MSEPFIAQITLFAGNFAPRSWAFCDGQLLAISSNTALFSLIGTIYGGDGRTTFALPDLRGRTPVGPRTGPGLSTYREGQRSGQEAVTLTANQLPQHSHTLNATNAPGDKGGPAGKMLAAGHGDETIYHDTPPAANIRAMASNSISGGGAGLSHNNMQPFLALNYIIALQGLFPSRN